ncbi:MAG: hypothetical protein HC767_10340, partial [Akkermansiaceae bacterium]|nr:hypothetical protein [Akkermansiaceae bacterium]
VADKVAAAKAAEKQAEAAKASPTQQSPAPSAPSAAAAAAAEAAAEASAAVPKAAAAAAAAAAKAAEAPPAKPPTISKEDSKDPAVTGKQPAGAPNLPGRDGTPVAKASGTAAPTEQPKPTQKPAKPTVTAQSSTQDIVQALNATKARLSGRKPVDSVRKPKDDLLPDPEAVERIKAKAEQAAEASYKAKAPPAGASRLLHQKSFVIPLRMLSVHNVDHIL